MLASLLSLVSLAAVANAYWAFGGVRPIVTTRLDPVIFPNMIGSHVHSVVGASRFRSVYDQTDLMRSNCTTIPVQPDKSNYWTPQLYHQDQKTGQLTPIPTGFSIYYLNRPGPKNATLKAFPPGFRMIAGDTNRRSFNASSFADQAVDFVCLDSSDEHANDPDWAERPSFFDHNCPNGMRAQVFFPSCWDGVNLDSADHKSHVAYPIQNFNDGDCPDSHPVHLVSLFYEMVVSVDQFDFWGPGTWVLANGDTTGFGHHGDFQNGWDVDLLQDALDNCGDANGDVLACAPLAAVFDKASADACVLETQIVDEDTGFDGPISQLPGCNPLWDGTGPRPTCAPENPPALVSATTPLPADWTEIGCIAEGETGRALTGASTTAPNMTRAVCAAFCEAKGFALAGAEFSDECYCDNEMQNGASNTTVTWNECSNHCAGNSNEICGGPNRLTLLLNSNLPAPSAALKSTASAMHSKSTSTPSRSNSKVSPRAEYKPRNMGRA
ncbi:WSC-domain-containing protein [Daedaleopsis nitida]|nr:WSC-domain-containing protein [Daedaleopsis nitida]